MGALRGFLRHPPRRVAKLVAAFGTLLAITTGHTILETGRDALFLSKLPAADLPWIYLLIAAFGLGLSQLGQRGGRADSKLAVSVSLVVARWSTLGFWAAAGDASSTVVLFALYVCRGSSRPGSWSSSGRCSARAHHDQAKRYMDSSEGERCSARCSAPCSRGRCS